mgnify:FL=1
MDFFGAQDRARRQTRVFGLLFSLAIILVIQMMNLLVIVIHYLIKVNVSGSAPGGFTQFLQWDQYLIVACLVTGFIALFGYLGIEQLFGGGDAVARLLGANLIARGTTDKQERLATQIVTEIAIAAGAPVPQLFLLKEPAINSFAAGWDSSDAVITLTTGALTHLDRYELQAMVAHEFCHILNGDMRLNQTMAGLLQGLFIIKEWSSKILENGGRHRSGKSSGYFYLTLFGFLTLGSFGYFLGRWIKSLLARQQEYHADAAAVQYTRNPEAVIGMLQKLGVNYIHSRMLGSRYEQFDHAFVGIPGNKTFINSHPPVEARIRRINPDWNIEFLPIDIERIDAAPVMRRQEEKQQQLVWTMFGLGVTESILTSAIPAFDKQIFDPEYGHRLPDTLLSLTRACVSSEATILAVLLASSKSAEQTHLKQLKSILDNRMYQKTLEILPSVKILDPRQRIPLIETCIPALKEMTKPQYLEFKIWIMTLFNADFKMDHDEFVVSRFVIARLDRFYNISKRPQKILNLVGDVRAEYELILSLIAYTEHDDSMAQQAFDAGKKAIAAYSLKLIPRNMVFLKQANTALDKLYALTPSLRKRLLQAAAATIALDGKITLKGFELLKTVAASLEVPMPPMAPVSGRRN